MAAGVYEFENTLERIEKPKIIIVKYNEIKNIIRLSEGSFGETYKGQIGEQEVIIKNYKNTREGFIPKDLIKEVSYLQLLNQFPETKSVKIVGLAFDDSFNVYLLLEKLKIDLFDFLRTRPFEGIENIKLLFFKLIKALSSVHKLGFLHSDIKIENIMFTDTYDIRLIDFGVSKFLSLNPSIEILKRLAGSESTRAPDARNVAKYFKGNRVSYSSDVYSLGIVFLQILLARNEIFEIEKPRIITYIDGSERSRFFREKIGDEGMDLIYSMTEKKATDRISLELALLHPFFTGVDDSMIFDRKITGGKYREVLVEKTLKENNIGYKLEDFENKNYELKYIEEVQNNYRFIKLPKIKLNAKIDFINICFLYLEKVLVTDWIGNYGNYVYNSFDVICNTILNYKFFNRIFSVEDLPEVIKTIGDRNAVYNRMLPDIMLISYINSQIFNISFLTQEEFLEMIVGYGGDFDTNLRSKQVFIRIADKEQYPIWLNMVYIDTKLKYEIRKPELNDLLGDIFTNVSLMILVFVLSMEEIGDITIWDIVKFCYIYRIRIILAIELDYLLENPIVDWLNIEKEKYEILETYYRNSLGFIRENIHQMYPIALELFGEL
jgi:serine/threonine protein kinase